MIKQATYRFCDFLPYNVLFPTLAPQEEEALRLSVYERLHQMEWGGGGRGGMWGILLIQVFIPYSYEIVQTSLKT